MNSLKREYISTEIAAHLLGLSITTMKRMRKNGDGPVFHKLGRSVKYTAEDLREWTGNNRHRTNRDFGVLHNDN